MVYSGKLGEPPPVRLPLRVAWVISGAVRTLYLCSFGLRRNVLDAPGDAEYNIFAAVSHEGTEMELQGLAALKYFPETLAMLVDNEVSCRLDPEASRANITTSLMPLFRNGAGVKNACCGPCVSQYRPRFFPFTHMTPLVQFRGFR